MTISTVAIVSVFIALVLGIALGWFAHGSLRPHSTINATRSLDHPKFAGDSGLLNEESVNQHPPASRPEPGLTPALESLAVVERSLENINGQLRTMESERSHTAASLTSQIQALSRTSTRLNERTDQLVNALRSPNVRGRWGEMQLERVVELGGMVEHCDFSVQTSAKLGERLVRPDMVVHLAGGRQIIVDAKVPFTSYLDALDTDDPEEHAGYLRRHAHLLRNHVANLSAKPYIDAFQPSPEFVVMFVPADPFLDSALNTDPELLEYAFSRNIVIATPTTLFGLLRTVALGWRQEDFSEKAKEIHELGRQLYSRLNTVSEHYNRVGRSLDKAVEAYNSTLSSLDSRVQVTARRLAEMGVSSREPTKPYHAAHRARHSSTDSSSTYVDVADYHESDFR
ncbi:DNA recombination protein RmuC [Corynebacterium pseudodiphtheriticum]|uniref:DNA recombination protein RmuC n=1 Tax=Corynebacterium pseudodiphtheriticum TaxID=37637 RepID=UPI00234C9B30|nr:DNA recombination protein RmuC [Corynebacterium pseudodiphtheriticum]MDC7088557.1 DNA recombination protein RmuC [Corynebacterium pseudodiphtheriticum]MDK4241105.1 DNA recombination protein RmuC [Corynebacterium pseudodiphtheriticum]MDK4320794.1 DNA recombination protein RmuC [Corynebacterium pseudodiphtheriticum]MDK8700408.1 DNA recombination protein RmuC [Corynebacterium pseudodiphtheriticum]MDK8774778.1 DNA recombination protein RmuC [Corynebacterium pseudodiphtheriticum]